MAVQVEEARQRLRGRKTAPAPPPWQPPAWGDFLQHRVIAAFDASLVNTGWVIVRAWLRGFDVIGHGTIRPKTEAVGFMATWERARLLEEALGREGLISACARNPGALMAVEAPSVGGGHRTESSLVAGLTVWRQAPAKCAVVSATHVSAVLLGDSRVRSGERKKAIREAVARYVPDSAGHGWNEHERDALSVGLVRLFDVREATA